MAEYDSDSSAGGDDIQTNVLLGYAAKEPTADDFSQLGGRAKWLDENTAPSGAYAKCRVCNGAMNLLLQLNGDLPDRFPGQERRLYVFGCRRKACRRKEGSIRALRAVRLIDGQITGPEVRVEGKREKVKAEPAINLGEALFGASSPTPAQANPFATSSSVAASKNPFSSAKPTSVKTTSAEQPSTSNGSSLAATFAQKASVSRQSTSPASIAATPVVPWQEDPTPYPSYYLDADNEYLEPEPESVPVNARVDAEAGSSNAADEKAAFESSMDKTFQKFADRLAQNPEQVLRYEFAGAPLLYSDSDAVGRLLSTVGGPKVQSSSSKSAVAALHSLRIPRCSSCGAARVFELQLTPHAIIELEAEDSGIDGMDWGTVIIGVCSLNCLESGRNQGEIGYIEEWVGVQWEEILTGKQR